MVYFDWNEDKNQKLKEERDISFEEIIEAGTLNSVLAGLGWQKIDKNWQPPQIISQNSINLKIPALA